MPTGFQIGPLYIRFYGIIIMVAALAGAWLASREARRRSENPELVWDGLVWVLIAGIIGSRVWHILTPPPSMVEQGITTMFYLTHPLDALAIWRGGLGIPGAIIGGVIGLYLFCRKNSLEFLTWVDIATPALALGQAIGRWGNFVNQEIYGKPTNLPWAIRIDPQYRLPEFKDVEYYHPVFLYESLWSLANMFILLWLARRYGDRMKPGDLFLVYLILYPVGRFILEFLRLDSAVVAGLNANQSLMLVIAFASAGLLIWRHIKSAQPAIDESADQD